MGSKLGLGQLSSDSDTSARIAKEVWCFFHFLLEHQFSAALSTTLNLVAQEIRCCACQCTINEEVTPLVY
ncbi:hypothetical protein CYMTET_44197 [Cymbomonas tetramitiformis]|uniref:Uncharacterized protein n=1 Tax=Cymbomonas tetramitiformis TaxID=36881 RepID=A0AAE0C202_9CHLO|nr:hypothetical protein CYMTET_44197 [Cymbomonas tetramitiformis]